MKIKDIKEYEFSKGCFHEDVIINGKDYDEYTKEEIIEFLLDMFNNNVDGDSLLRNTFENAISYLEFPEIEKDNSICDQCGDYNYYQKYSLEE